MEDSAGFGYLTSPAEGCGTGPTATRPQLLQLSSLLPKDFERLCFRLTRLNGTVETCRFYGVDGEAQQGIDLYARRRDGSYMVVQCKRSRDGFTPGEVTEAVDKFLVGDWADTSAVFVLAVTANLEGTSAAERVERERPRLTERGIGFQVWDETEISALMKDHPRLVDDFFSREAVKTFLGADVAGSLGDRLDAAEVIEYRAALGNLYREVFGRLERGMHIDDRNVALGDRFVLPDVLVSTDTGAPVPALEPPRTVPMDTVSGAGPGSRTFPDVTASLRNPALGVLGARPAPDHYGVRANVIDWLSTGERHVVVGVPGSGKSALLRTLVLDVFADEPQFIAGVDRLHNVLPVWLPFAFWTRAARNRPDAVSVLDGVREWLNAYDHGHLGTLIEKTLRDERVMLVVDGLDEWASPDLARVCVDRLEVFASTKHASVLASSRPFSTSELPIESSRWRRATLAPLDQEQQRAFITKWLVTLVDEPVLTREAADWAAEIESSAHLRELSDLPLFLLLLLRSREQLTEFPEDLYAVLGDAIGRLVGEHRRRKIDVANAADLFPSTGDIRKISAATAEHMHLGSALSISDDDLRDLFRRTLSESIGYPAAEAHAMATTLVNSLSPGVGLMVRPAPDETTFFHRSVLEYLAGERMLVRPNADQIALFREHLTDRRWSQVLRFLIRGLVRPPEIIAIFDALDQTDVHDPQRREYTDLLAADVVVGGGQADAVTRRRLLDRVIREIETGERTAHRARLIDRLVVGLSRREIRGELQTRFEGWLRAVSREMWPAVLGAAASWQADDTLLGLLWHALLNDSDQVHRVAARVLGTRFAGNTDVVERLVALADTTRLPHRRAAATEALSLGWPQHNALDSLINTGRQHPDFAVRHASIAADLRRGNINDANRTALTDLLDHSPTIDSWSGGLLELMFTHYPDDQTILDHYLPHADPGATDQFRHGDVPATFLILKGYTSRPEAKQFFLKFIAADRQDFHDTPSNLTDRVPWKEIANVYSGDDEVVAAVERLVSEYGPESFYNRDMYFCSRVARTVTMRDKLIARVQSRENYGIGWAIKALLEGWLDDPAVRGALSQVIDPADGSVPDGAVWHLADIIPDPDAALDRLASIASHIDHQGAVVSALSDIVERGGLRDDPRSVAIINHALSQDMTSPWTSPETALYTGFPDQPGVRDLALTRLDDRDAPLDKIACGFRADEQMRHHIAGRLQALGPPLRGRLVEGLTETPPADAAVTAILGRYDAEPDPAVKLLGATAFAGRLQSTGTVTDEMIDLFTEQAQAGGPDHHERRAAAFGALARVGRLDRLTDLRERYGDARPLRIHHSYLSDAALFFRVVCRYWDDVKTALGDNPGVRFGFDNSSDEEFWQKVLAVAYDYPATRDDLGILLDQRPALAGSAAGVAYLSRVEPGSDRLWDATVQLLRRAHAGAYMDIQPAWTALHVLAEQFADHPRAVAWLDSELEHVHKSRTVHDGRAYLHLPSFGTVAAIARLRPTHPVVDEMLVQVQRVEGEPWHTFHEWTELAAATVQSARSFVDLAVEISRLVRINDMFAEYIHRPLTARLRRDGSLAASVSGLVPALSGTAVGISVRLLSLSDRLDGVLVQHLRSRIASRRNESPDTFDPLVGQASHIELLVLDILDTSGT